MLGQAEGVKEYNYSYFNVLKYDVASLRQNALANTSAALAPWLNWKSFCYHCAPSHYWQERILHLALTGEHGRSCGPLGSGFSSLGCAAHTDRRDQEPRGSTTSTCGWSAFTATTALSRTMRSCRRS